MTDLTVQIVNETGRTSIEKYNELVKKYFAEVESFENEEKFTNYLTAVKDITVTFNREISTLIGWRDKPGRLYNARNPVCVAVFSRIPELKSKTLTMQNFASFIDEEQKKARRRTAEARINPNPPMNHEELVLDTLLKKQRIADLINDQYRFLINF